MMYVETASRGPDRVCTHELLFNSASRIRGISLLDKQNKGLITGRELGTLVSHHSCHNPASSPSLLPNGWIWRVGLMYYVYITQRRQAHARTPCTLSNNTILIITGDEKGEF